MSFRSQLALLACVAALLAGPIAAQKKQPAPGSAPAQGPTVRADILDLVPTPETLAFEAVDEGDEKVLFFTLRNTGFSSLTLRRVQFLLGASGNSAAFTLTIAGKNYRGGAADTTRTITPGVPLAPGQEVSAHVTFEPTEEVFDDWVLRFEGTDYRADLRVTGLGGHAGDPFLHVAIEHPDWVVDYELDGQESVVLDGTGSHTHEPGHSLVSHEWTREGVPIGSTPVLATSLTKPLTSFELEITDDNVPPRTLADQITVAIVPPDEVPGVLVHYHDASVSGASALLDAVPEGSDFIEQRPSLVLGGVGQVGGSPYTGNVLVRLVGRIRIEDAGVYTLTALGGAGHRLFLDGVPADEPLFLVEGQRELEARFAVNTLADLPLEVQLSSGGPSETIEPEFLSHDETVVAPVIHSMTATGAVTGGTPITINGFGFFPPNQVVVHWGDLDLIAADFTSLTPGRIQFPSPPGGGAIAVSVETFAGHSNVRTFLYELSGPPPIQFRRDLILGVSQPTAGAWGPDGRLYVTSLDGHVTAYTFDEDYELLDSATYAGVSALTNHETLGIALNPFDPPEPVKLYVAHGDHYLHGGATPTEFSPYTGQISVLTGPDFDAPVPLVTGLPVSNHDHALNGLVFDHNGDLLISVGSMTNAGVKDPDSGDLPESPLSAAIVKARTSKPDFQGAVQYVETLTGLPNDDQRSGEQVDVAPGSDVVVHAHGLRNAFGLVYTTTGRLYATDNGPNVGFGAASTGPTTQSADPYDDDELNLVEAGNYYGSPNRARGRSDQRQNVYRAGLAGPASIPDTFFQMVSWLPPSSDGIDEYRADTFQGQIRGQLIVQEYQNKLRRVRLKSDGRGLLGQNVIDPITAALGCLTGPGGAILALDHGNDELEILEPTDLTPLELVVHDIFPWRAPAAGGAPFVIAGRGFGTLGTTSVTIGGLPAVLTAVSWGRIHGFVPENLAPSTQLVDVVVHVGSASDTLTQAFRYLFTPGQEPGRWETLANLSTPLGEVAAGVIQGVMYLVGEGSSATFAYDVQNRQWLANKASRPFNGHHHSAEVLDGKLYLVGGLGGGSEGRLQIFDPLTNSWTTGASMPWSGGSVSTAVIAGKLYAAGGIVSTFTVANCARYDPLTNTWTTLAAMPDGGRNHAAAGTDGQKLWVFGGRRAGNFPTNGYDSVMVYDPGSNTWDWSGAIGATLAPLPEARGGMGKAVRWGSEFYVFGGETLDDPDADANGVYPRVDVYSPATNTWRRELDMPVARHGIFPVLYQGWMFLAGGGTVSANSQSTRFDAFTRQ